MGDGPKVLISKKRAAQDRVLSLLSQGSTVIAAMGAVGREVNRFYQWRMDEPWFKEASDAVRVHVDGDRAPPFVEFRKAFFGFDTFRHQQKIIDALNAAKARSVTMVLLPPGAGKTTVLEDWICHLLANDPDERICVISEGQDHAKKIVRRVANRMTDHGRFGAFINRFGPFRPDETDVARPWSAQTLTLARASSGERDYSLEARGAGSAIYGARFTRIILDDVQSTKNLNSTDKLVDYFRQDVYTRLPPDMTVGRIYIVGTRVGQDDFYETLLREDMVDDLVKIPALIEHDDVEGKAVSYWPKRKMPDGSELGFDLDDLADIERRVGPQTWSRVYMQEPVSKRGATFSEQLVNDALDQERSIKDVHAVPGLIIEGALDPALAGHSVFRIAAFSYDHLYLLDGCNLAELTRYEEMWDKIDELSAIWRPSNWTIEGNAVQGGIARSDAIQEIAKNRGFTITAHQTGRNKMDETIGVASMTQSFRTRSISIPWADPESQEAFAQLPIELKRWRADVPTKMLRQDEVMCLWFLHLRWQQLRHTLASRLDNNIQTRGLPWRPMGLPGRGPVLAGAR